MRNLKKVWLLSVCLILIMSFIEGPRSVNAASKNVNLKMANGALYYGEVKNGKPHGKGTMKWSANKSYSGEWVNGRREGLGKYIFIEELIDDALEQPAKYSQTYVYNGVWKNDRKNGQGTYTEHSNWPYPADQGDLVQKGVFKDNKLIQGYSIEINAHETANYNYKDAEVSIQIWQEKSFPNGYSASFPKNYSELLKIIIDNSSISFQKNGIEQDVSNEKFLKAQLKPYIEGFDQVIKIANDIGAYI